MPVAGAPYIGHGLGPSIAAYVPMLLQQPRLPSAPELTVRVAKKGAKPLAGAFHYPGHAPPGVGASNFGCVGFTPTRPLESKTTYRCELKLSLGFRPGAREGTVLEYAWEFTTR